MLPYDFRHNSPELDHRTNTLVIRFPHRSITLPTCSQKLSTLGQTNNIRSTCRRGTCSGAGCRQISAHLWPPTPKPNARGDVLSGFHAPPSPGPCRVPHHRKYNRRSFGGFAQGRPEVRREALSGAVQRISCSWLAVGGAPLVFGIGADVGGGCLSGSSPSTSVSSCASAPAPTSLADRRRP